MKITALEAFPVALPFREPYVTSTGTLERREMVLLRLGSGDDSGWGDAVPLSLRGGDPLDAVLADLEVTCAACLIGAELGPRGDDPLARCAEAGVSAPALAAADAALLDLAGRVRGEPAWALLGAGGAGPVECNGTVGADAPAIAGEQARRLVGLGFTTLKVKVGTGSDVERVAAVRDATDSRARIRIDANGAWDVDAAVERIGAIHARSGLELVEQPCRSLDELAAVRRRVDVPVVADESVATASEADLARELRACDAATLKLAKVGGPRSALRLAGLLPTYLSSALDSPLGIVAALATAQALPEIRFPFAHGLATSALFADNVADVSALIGPTIEPRAGAGLGVEVDEDAIDRLRIR